MTTTPTTTQKAHHKATGETFRSRMLWGIRDCWTIVLQEFTHLFRQPSTFAWQIGFPVVMVLMFVYVFGSAMDVTGQGAGEGYVDFAMPGMFAMAMAPNQPGIISGGVKTDEMKPRGNATAKSIPAVSVFLMHSPRKMPTKMSAKRSHSNRAKAARVAPRLPPERHPINRATPAMTTRSIPARITSETARPVTGAEEDIGIDRKRSMKPFSLLCVTA